ncbi:hypothetical protein [uncultured Roseobacter sp.]|uniref:hypothetical protein n=1 Tax=uncultured Roseobacter sp. TaxID=114847 RepID=UPI002604168A|nr:hypothetical protein [uncultured Roseobacter sp.]
MTIMNKGFDTKPIEMVPMWQVTFLASDEDIDRIFDAVADVAPLTYGATDRNGQPDPGRPFAILENPVEGDIRRTRKIRNRLI